MHGLSTHMTTFWIFFIKKVAKLVTIQNIFLQRLNHFFSIRVYILIFYLLDIEKHSIFVLFFWEGVQSQHVANIIKKYQKRQIYDQAILGTNTSQFI